MKEKAKWILGLVVKRRHSANGILFVVSISNLALQACAVAQKGLNTPTSSPESSLSLFWEPGVRRRNLETRLRRLKERAVDLKSSAKQWYTITHAQLIVYIFREKGRIVLMYLTRYLTLLLQGTFRTSNNFQDTLAIHYFFLIFPYTEITCQCQKWRELWAGCIYCINMKIFAQIKWAWEWERVFFRFLCTNWTKGIFLNAFLIMFIVQSISESVITL